MKITKGMIYRILLTAVIFWFLDFVLHFTGVGESNYYYTIKLANSFLFAFIWFVIFDSKKHSRKLLFSIVFGTWISFFYLVSSYSGLVQFFGIVARYSAPLFVVFEKTFSSFFWWVFHIIAFYVGLEISSFVKNS